MDAPVLLTPPEPEAAIHCLGNASWVADFNKFLLASANTSTAWGTANKAMFFPFSLSVPRTIRKVSWLNGGVVNGNVDVGVYDRWGNLIQSLGSTAQAGVSAIQIGDITDFSLDPAIYWAALASSSATAAFSGTPTYGASNLQVYGVQTMAAAFPLPATVTFANPTGSIPIPWLALNFLSIV